MEKDQRHTQKPVPENLEQYLTLKQQAALKMVQSLGWRLQFVRRPLFQQPEPVVCNAKLDQIGILDPDGNIDLELELKVRPSVPEEDLQPATTASPDEDRRKGMAPVPGNLENLLNNLQLRALQHIESFGWKLHFVRRPMFQEPVAGIISPEGDKVATLEKDGRINVMPDSEIRTQDTKPGSEETDSPAPEQGSKTTHPG